MAQAANIEFKHTDESGHLMDFTKQSCSRQSREGVCISVRTELANIQIRFIVRFSKSNRFEQRF